MQSKDSFKALPLQIEWAIVVALFFDAYRTYYSGNLVAVAHILLFFIILNGWISSKSTHPFYTDSFLILDTVIVVIYFFMILALGDYTDRISYRFWLFSATLSLLYVIWNINLRNVVERSIDSGFDAQRWKVNYYNKVIKKYVFIMLGAFLFYGCLYVMNIIRPIKFPIYIDILGLTIWFIVIFLWWKDHNRIKTT